MGMDSPLHQQGAFDRFINTLLIDIIRQLLHWLQHKVMRLHIIRTIVMRIGIYDHILEALFL